MKNLRMVTGVAAALALTVTFTGCDRLVGDHITPVMVQTQAQGADANPAHLEPGLWTATPQNTEEGCLFSVFRNGYPIVRSEVYDSLPVYVWLPPTTETDQYGFATRGCTEWNKVDG